ncbi:MAG: CsbD family protein [Desulfobacterales bacterium]
MKSSSQDKAEGKWHKVKGKIKEVAGKAVGNRNLEAEGKVENVDGKVQEKIGEIKDVAGK